MELDDPHRPGEPHGPGEYGVAYGEGHQNQDDADYHCQNIIESIQYLCHGRYPCSKNRKAQGTGKSLQGILMLPVKNVPFFRDSVRKKGTFKT